MQMLIMKKILNTIIAAIGSIVSGSFLCWLFYPDIFSNGIHRINWKMLYNWQVPILLSLPFIIFIIIRNIRSYFKNKKRNNNIIENEYPSYGQNGERFYKIESDGEVHDFEHWELDAEIQYFYREFLAGKHLTSMQLMLIRWYCDTFSNAKWTTQAKEMLNKCTPLTRA